MLLNKCSGSCNTLDNPMSKICVLKIIKNVNIKTYNFLMRLNETRNVLWHKSCKCISLLNSSACNSKQIWNSENCVCKNKLVDRIIGECTSLINETMMNNVDNKDNDNTITYIFIGLFSILLFIGIVCFCVFAYFKWSKGKKLFKNKYTDYWNTCKALVSATLIKMNIKSKNKN